MNAIFREMDRAKVKFPEWPTDPLHALGIVAEEYGELAKEVLQLCYEPQKSSRKAVAKELDQLICVALRFRESLETYDYKPGLQHLQRVACAVCDRGDHQLGHAVGCPAAEVVS